MEHTDSFDELFPHPKVAMDAEKLLLEWSNWWYTADEAPAKMPESLHIRTSMYFILRQREQSR